MTLNVACPRPLRHDTIQMAHGGGGRVMRELLEGLMLPTFKHPALLARNDGAVLQVGGERLAFTTDTFVVSPRTFPGGDIGKLAVIGTVNDLAVSGATPLFLSCAMVLEEGFPIAELTSIVQSMQATAEACGVAIVTGDTKVVDRGRGDGIYLNTAGIGQVPAGVDVGPHRVTVGDAILVSGDIGRHGMAIMSLRESLSFESPLTSDCASIHRLAQALLRTVDVHAMRDPTRGGLAAVLNEMALDQSLTLEVHEPSIPVDPAVAAACELLGLDPAYVACEGRLVAFVPEADADRALEALRALPEGQGAARIGTVLSSGTPQVTVRTTLGTRRVMDLLSGEQLPRIC